MLPIRKQLIITPSWHIYICET